MTVNMCNGDAMGRALRSIEFRLQLSLQSCSDHPSVNSMKGGDDAEK